MSRNSLLDFQSNGDGLPDNIITLLGLPSIPSAIRGASSTSGQAGTGYVTAKYAPNKIILTAVALVVAVTDDGSTGSASVKLLDFPAAGVYRIAGVVPNLTGAVTASWNPTTPVAALGSAAAGSGATLVGTEADVVQSTSLTITSDAFPFKPDNTGGIIALTDSSGGTGAMGGTLPAISSTFAQTEVRNSIAVLAAQVEALRTASAGTYQLNATASAGALYWNFACNSDPSTGKTITLSGTLTISYANLGDN